MSSRFHAGGGEVVSEGSVSSFFSNFNERVSDHKARGKAQPSSLVMTKGTIDRQNRLPTWMHSETPFAIDGSKLGQAEIENSYLGRYKQELAVGVEIQKAKKQGRYEYANSAIGWWNNRRRAFGLKKPLELDPVNIEEEVKKRWSAEVDEMEFLKKEKKGVRVGKEASWNNIMEDLSQKKPLSKMSKTYRPRVDVYGIDAFLDSGISVIVGATKWAAIVGSAIGGFRGTRSLAAEMATVLSSGVSFLVMANFIMLATAFKYATMSFIASSGFVLGDKTAKYVKRLTYKDQVLAERRSTSNYVLGFSCALAPVGLTPYWFFSDVRLGLRYGVTGAFVGGLCGLLVSRVVDRLGSVNLQRINATDRQLRRYEAVMRRQREWKELETQRRLENNEKLRAEAAQAVA